MQSRRQRARTERGFTLIELLLTLGLLLLLIGAVVFSFSSLQRGAVLEEGANQFEALLRFARAHAADTGRQIEIRVEEQFADDPADASGGLRVLWEPDPVAQPGVFEELADAADFVRAIADLVNVQGMRPWPRPDARPAATATGASAENEAEPGTDNAPAGEAFMPLRFYPDGSADSMEIILAARDETEPRRLSMRFLGLSGTVARRFLAADGTASSNEPKGGAEAEPPHRDRPAAAQPAPGQAAAEPSVVK